jgi:hypothetical protein
LKTAERPAIIVGGGALRYDGVHGAALALANKYKLVRDGWNGFNVLHFAAARMGGLMLGFAHDGGIKALAAKKPKLAFFLGADEADYGLFADSFKVYVGHHGDNGAHHADVILPGAAYSEKSGTYVNLEGRVQRGLPLDHRGQDHRRPLTLPHHRRRGLIAARFNAKDRRASGYGGGERGMGHGGRVRTWARGGKGRPPPALNNGSAYAMAYANLEPAP